MLCAILIESAYKFEQIHKKHTGLENLKQYQTQIVLNGSHYLYNYMRYL